MAGKKGVRRVWLWLRVEEERHDIFSLTTVFIMHKRFLLRCQLQITNQFSKGKFKSLQFSRTADFVWCWNLRSLMKSTVSYSPDHVTVRKWFPFFKLYTRHVSKLMTPSICGLNFILFHSIIHSLALFNVRKTITTSGNLYR